MRPSDNQDVEREVDKQIDREIQERREEYAEDHYDLGFDEDDHHVSPAQTEREQERLDRIRDELRENPVCPEGMVDCPTCGDFSFPSGIINNRCFGCRDRQHRERK
jgi:hypothetical protein